MDTKSFINLVKTEIVKYYNTEMPAGFRSKAITESDIIIPGERWPTPVSFVKIAKDETGRISVWSIDNVTTENVSNDHLFFSASYYDHISKVFPGKDELVLNATYRLSLLNRHKAFEEDGGVIEVWEGQHK